MSSPCAIPATWALVLAAAAGASAFALVACLVRCLARDAGKVRAAPAVAADAAAKAGSHDSPTKITPPPHTRGDDADVTERVAQV